MQNDPSARRSVEGLSRFLSGPEGTLALARMQVLHLPAAQSADVPVPRPRDDRVGVWRRSGDTLVRDADLRQEWRYWADLDQIFLDGSRRRVAVVGESATRGYFFDPAHSVAGLIGTVLGDGIDVLDLARTNCSLEQLLQAVADATKLGIDALVVHAGNNWNNVVPYPREAQHLAELLRQEGFPAAMRAFRRLVADVGASALEVVRKLTGDIPVVLVVPEFNLAGWVEEESLACPALPGTQRPQWLALRRRAEAAIAVADRSATADLVARMIELDGGASPVSQRLLAEAAPDEATRIAALEASRDAVVSPFTLHSPRTLTSVQQAMRTLGAELGFHVVDQTELFRTDGTAPGPRFFLDYCHLTFEGLRLTAAAVADALAGVLALPASGGDPAAEPEPHTIALAHFLAAIHNAHYGQPADVLRHHVRAALDADSSVAERVKDYLDYQTRLAPNWMCASYERSAQVPAFRRYMVVGDGRLNGKLADHLLRDIMLEELSRVGHDVRDSYEQLLIAEHAGSTDLLADAYLAATFAERAEAGVGPRTAYLRAGSERTSSTFVLAEPVAVLVRVTWRLPASVPSSSAEVTVTVNGQQVRTAELGAVWRTDDIVVDAGLMRRGLNTIAIHWPVDAEDAGVPAAAAAARLECGEMPESRPVHGHVHAWTVEPVSA
ncbi:hypothetical protein AB0J80_31840 [Actinoplanes sp. NPDC049548]|uniref:hypothetical protein n=1 Tax=Actinoplanes sp. NPDC049548 TaxID=3155152 RepID=UPI0034376A5F